MITLPERTADYKLNITTFRVMYGDITRITADVIVNSADELLTMGGGISYAIANAGGEIIIEEARKHIPLKLGDVAVTSAGKLSAKHIFHVVTIDYSNMTRLTEESIQKATQKCLELADNIGVRTIVFPALGTGVAGFPFSLAAELMTRTIADYLMGDTKLELVTISLYPREIVSESDLNTFFERSVALATLYTQSKRLGTLLKELGKIVNGMNLPSVSKKLMELQTELSHAQDTLSESPQTLETQEAIQNRSGIEQVSQKVVSITSELQGVSAWDDKQLEAEVLRTKMAGLLTQLNIQTANLNRFQIEKAKYGGVALIPPRLEWAIEEAKQEIADTETKIKEARTQIVSIVGNRT